MGPIGGASAPSFGGLEWTQALQCISGQDKPHSLQEWRRRAEVHHGIWWNPHERNHWDEENKMARATGHQERSLEIKHVS